MKKFRSYFILILAAAVMSGCSGLNKMKKNSDLVKYDVTPEVLEAHAGTVNVTIDGVFPEKYFDKKTTLTATPVLTYPGGETIFKDVKVVQGESVTANNQVISRSGGNFKYTGSVPYNESMKKSELMLRVQASRGSKTVDFDPVKLADGVIATSTLVGQEETKPVVMEDNFARIVPESQTADIHYIINRADILSKELKAEDIALLKEYIQTVNTDPDREFKGVEVNSYASPDGEYDFNDKLSEKRGSSADRLIKRELSKIEAAKDPNFVDAKTVAEDWDGFRTEVEKSDIRDKELILRVLSMYSDPAVREREIRNMSSTFDELKSEILPKLRRSKMIVNADKIGRTDEQILSQMRSDPSVLGLEEMLYAATLTNDLNEQLKFYQATANVHPKCIRAQNNIGYTYMALGQTDNAIKAFEAARNMQNNDVVKNNLGFASLAKGDIAKAEEYFNSMTSSTAESRWGLGVIAITRGEYDKAVNNFGNQPSYNLALAQVLKGDAKAAKNTLDNLKDTGKTGKPSYLKAIVGARLDDKNYMMNNLREAIGFDSKWKEYAKTDLEFAKFFNDNTFTSAVQ